MSDEDDDDSRGNPVVKPGFDREELRCLPAKERPVLQRNDLSFDDDELRSLLLLLLLAAIEATVPSLSESSSSKSCFEFAEGSLEVSAFAVGVVVLP